MLSIQEYRSKIEDIVAAVELKFPSTPGFGKYKPFLEHAIAHPAKMNTLLLEFLILNHTSPGDIVLDPMAGSGSTGVVAALNGRNAICVELEQKFFEWMEKARELVEKHPSLTLKGKIKNILGDARQLSNLIETSNIDALITSPPYSDVAKANEGAISPHMQGLISKLSGIPVKEFAHNVEKLKEAVRIAESKIPFKYSDNIDNIGNLSYGSIDAIITSPPYADAKKGGEADKEAMAERWDTAFKESGASWNSWGKTWKTEGRLRALEALGSGYSENKENIGNLPFGNIDTIITSPPYSEGIGHDSGDNASKEHEWRLNLQRQYTRQMTSEGNIAKLKHGNIDAVITSPPYENTCHCRGHTERQERLTTEKSLFMDDYGRSKGNIGNMKRETYLEAMLKAYSEMFKVLKSGGLAIVVVKAFIRNKQIVDLPYHTWLLMEKVGFKLEKVYKLRLDRQSFWRVLYYKKHPEVPVIAHEHILVCRKP